MQFNKNLLIRFYLKVYDDYEVNQNLIFFKIETS